MPIKAKHRIAIKERDTRALNSKRRVAASMMIKLATIDKNVPVEGRMCCRPSRVNTAATRDQVVEYALETNIDLVLFCGDAYKSRDPSQTQQREFARRIERLSSSGI